MRRFLVLVALVAGFVPAAAHALDIDASVDRTRAGVGEQIVLTVVVNGTFRNLGDPVLPDLGDAFQVHDAGTSRNFSFINGRASSSVSFRYVLVPRREGSFTVGPISVTHDDETVSTRPIGLQVTASTAPAPPALEPDLEGNTSGSRDVFVRALVDETSPFVSQQVTLRIQLYSALPLLENPNFSPPSTEGFWREELASRQVRVATLEGRRYQVMEVAFALFPTRPGTLTLGPATLDCRVRPARASSDPFRSLGSFFDGERVVVTSDPIAVEVRPLPGGAPAGYRGAVGEFRLETSADRTRVPQNEPVWFRVELTGTGNLRTLGEITLPDLPGFRAYPEQSSTEPSTVGDVLGGRVVQEFVLVPLRAGRLELPALEIPVFSPAAGTYVTLRSPAIPIQVTAAAAEGEGGMTPSSRGDIEAVGKDIRFLELDPPSFTRVEGGVGPALRWLRLLPLPALAYLGFFAVERRRRKLAGDPRGLRRSRAAREARRRLREAAATSPEEQAAVAGETLRGYVADRHDLPAAGVTTETVRARTGAAGEELAAFLDRCDAVRYAPGIAAPDEDLLAAATAWVDRLEASR